MVILAGCRSRIGFDMALIKCYDCGHTISDSAIPCPRCRTISVRGVQCEICNERMRESESIFRPMGYGFGQRQVHHKCGRILFGYGGQCRECSRNIWASSFWQNRTWTGSLRSAISDLEAVAMRHRRSPWEWATDWGIPHPRECSNCGVYDPLRFKGICATCRLPIYEQLHPTAKSGGWLKHRECEARR